MGKPAKLTIAIVTDLLLVPIALWLAFFFRLGTSQLINSYEYAWLFMAALVTAIPVFAASGLYQEVLRYMGRTTISTLLKAVSTAALLLALVIYLAQTELLVPRSVVFNYWILLFVLVGGARFIGRAVLVPDKPDRFFASLIPQREQLEHRRPIAIYGAGDAGYQLYTSILDDRDMVPVAFIDDNAALRHRTISGLKVYGPDELEALIQETDIREVFLAMPSLRPGRRREILESLEPTAVHVRTVPSVHEIMTGRRKVAELRDVQVEDILGREIVSPDPKLMQRCIRSQSVLVTGAGGSIGSELCRQIVEQKPVRLVLFEHSEFNLYSIEQELRTNIEKRQLDVELIGVLGSVLDSPHLTNVMSSFEIDTIYHVAAYKHVPIVERNIVAGIRNNVFGTLFAAQAALRAKVSNFVLISTDKAVRPTNIMGASKRLAELILQALAFEEQPELISVPGSRDSSNPQSIKRSTRFTMVRFGNVLDSSGSVIPIFRKQIELRGPVTVTHPEVTRYFMTIPEAAQLVIQASSLGTGGEVFVLDMGQPVKILELAQKMIRLSGLTVRDAENPDGDVAISFVGLRPGEKLFEELHIGSDIHPTGHPKIQRALENMIPWSEMVGVIHALQAAIESNDLQEIHKIFTETVDGFAVSEPLVDWMFEIGSLPKDNVGNLVAMPASRRLSD
ncbi:MAG: nucleoside-diphosphate sugar epimerase/dehydratase [Pseudomonadales bacterium]